MPDNNASLGDSQLSRGDIFTQRVGDLEKKFDDVMTRLDRAQRTQEHNAVLSTADQKVNTAQRAVDDAQAALEKAYEDNEEGSVIAARARALSEASASLERSKLEQTQIQREVERRTKEADKPKQDKWGDRHQATQEPEADATNLREWEKKNATWWGTDQQLTEAAYAIDKQIRLAGVIPVGSETYFNTLDAKMAEQFPDRFRKEGGEAQGGSSTRGDNPASSSHEPGTVRLNAAMKKKIAAMGLTEEQYLEGYKTAVARGDQPARESLGGIFE